MVMRTPAAGSASLMPSSPTGRTIRESRCGARLAPSRMHRAESRALAEHAGHLERHDRVVELGAELEAGQAEVAPVAHQGTHRGEQVGDGLGVVRASRCGSGTGRGAATSGVRR